MPADLQVRAAELAEQAIGKESAHAVADEVEAWCRGRGHDLRIVLCGHAGDYPSLDGWDVVTWERPRPTYGSDATRAKEALWASPACLPAVTRQMTLFAEREQDGLPGVG